ncbi:MAG: sulfite exporter TauE/SafE family protein [Coprobacillus sp.]
MIYFIIAFSASIIGAISGMGGGIIIKPLLDVLGHYDISTINLLSSFTVLSMAIASLTKHYYYKTSFDQNMAVILSIGAIVGAMIGDSLLNRIIENSLYPHMVKQLQNIILLFLLIFVYVYMNIYKEKIQFHISNRWIIAIIGMSLGFISTLTGIGGGPINIMILTLFFSMSTKDAVIYSLILIFFSQFSKVINVLLNGNLFQYDLTMLIYMIPAGVIGGIIGSNLNKKIPPLTIHKVFNIVLLFTLCTTLYNIFH